MENTFDFEDGAGSVLAKRHKNPNGFEGGWVADSASVEPTCFIGYDAMVYGNARVSDNARVYGYAKVFGNAMVYGNARVSGDAMVFGYAMVYGNARVSGNAIVSGDASVSDKAEVSGNARVHGNAVISQEMYVSFSTCEVDLTDPKNIRENIKAQTGLIASNKSLICFKQVNDDKSSFYDPYFKYTVNSWIEALNVEYNNVSCTSGLHFSNATYWENQCSNKTYLICRVNLEDIITVQFGKIRAKKCFVMECIKY